MKNFNSLFLVVSFLFYQVASAQWLSTDGQNIVSDAEEEIILRGMGLGGWMLMEGYMMQTAEFANPQYQIREKIKALIGEEDTQIFFDAWLANHVNKTDIDSLKSWGFNSVRLPMHYNLFTLPIEKEVMEGENTWLNKGFELTDQLIEWCKANEMYVILDLHAAPGGQGYDQGISDYDPSKPSLWESELNRAKTVALWKRIANRYKDEPWVGGYDLINEPNWEIENNVLLKNLYKEITEAIREVDNRHIIFIEGNWFANDFTNLTPPWDDNMVYSPHKYWSINDQASIQWVLDIREEYNVPLYFGESGENSNVWFRDAIKLFEDNNLGWAWWPLKKIESIASPISIIKSSGYEALLNYWKGNTSKPTVEAAKNTLMDLTNKAKISECRFQKEVIDAMFRQVNSDETVPYTIQNIPGIVYATDYDMGVLGEAYYDLESANYQVTTGSYTSWNNGWIYRNDGVDIETTEDTINSNGYNVGWIGSGEWLQYSVNVKENALYDIEMRVASNESGQYYFSIDNVNITPENSITNTGGWQNWETVIVPNVVLRKEDKSLRLHIIKEGFNLSSFKFVKKGETNDINTTSISAITLDENNVRLDLNKPLQSPLTTSLASFTIDVNGSSISITNAQLVEGNRAILFNVNHSFKSSELIQISYNGTDVIAADGTALSKFTQKEVKNTLAVVHQIPGRMEAEDFFFQSGIQLETTTDIGGGQNIGYLDAGDYLDYYVEVPTSGTYNITYRTAAESESGAVQLEIIEANGINSIVNTINFPATGGWQNWTNTNSTAFIKAGTHQLRVVITAPLFNINWLEFDLINNISLIPKNAINLYPNPTKGEGFLNFNEMNFGNYTLKIYNNNGQFILNENITVTHTNSISINLNGQQVGIYYLLVESEKGSIWAGEWLKMH